MLHTLRFLMRPNDQWELNFNERTEEWELLQFLIDMKFGGATSVWITRWTVRAKLIETIETERVQPLLIRNLKRFFSNA